MLPVPFLLRCGLRPPQGLSSKGGRTQRCREGTEVPKQRTFALWTCFQLSIVRCANADRVLLSGLGSAE